MRVLIVGGGISGLSAGYYLHQLMPKAEITISESSARFGGQIWTFDGVDVGGEAIIPNKPGIVDLLAELKLDSILLRNDISMSPRIYHPDDLLPLPSQSFMGIPSKIESIKDYLSPAEYHQAEILSQKKILWDKHTDMTIAQLIDNSLGAPVRKQVIDPLLSGVYAASTEHISVRYAMPLLAQTLDQGSDNLLDAVQAVISPSELSPQKSEKPRLSFISFPGGLENLISVLLNKIPAKYVPRTERIIYRAGYYQVVHAAKGNSAAQEVKYDAIILACRPDNTGRLLQHIASEAAECIGTIPLSSPVIIAAHTDLSLAGISGILVPELYPHIHAKAITHISNKWPQHMERNIIRMSYGRLSFDQKSQLHSLPSRERILEDLQYIVGKSVQVDRAYSFSYPRTLPVINPEKWQDLGSVSELLPSTVAIAGAYIQGVGIPSCINSAWEAVQRVAAV